MNQFQHWLAMGGYSAYVWSAYGLACTVLIAHILTTKYQYRQVRKKLMQWFARQIP